MINKRTLKLAAKAKLRSAKILYNNGQYDDAGYLLGYVVEISLKTMICKRLNLIEYPDTGNHKSIFTSHDFDRLLLLSGYSGEIQLNKNRDLFNNWSILTKDWEPEIRYNENTYSQSIISAKLSALEDPTHGFFTWIKKRW